jgi:WD40 repeat protein
VAPVLIACMVAFTALGEAPTTRPVVVPINAANRPAASVECRVTVGPTVPIVALAFSPDGKTLAAGGYREVLLWDLAAAKLGRRIAANGVVGAVAFLKEGQVLAIGEGSPGECGAVRLVDAASGKDLCRFAEPKDAVCAIAVSPDGKWLAACATTKAAYVWDVEQKKLATTIQGHNDRVLDVGFSPNGKVLITVGEDNTGQLWNVGDWSPVARFTESYPVRCAAFGADEVQVFMGVGNSEGSGLRIRKMDTPAFRRPIGLGMAVPLGMAGPTKAGRAYVACSDKTVKVFDVKNGNQVGTWNGHQDWVQTVAISADEAKVASGSADGTVKVWNAADGRLLATLVQTAMRADEWVIVTPQGYVAASSDRAIEWKGEKLAVSGKELTKELSNGEMVAKAIAGEKVAAATVK